jgi:hypothetical protein
MRLIATKKRRRDFEVLHATRTAQAAMMTLSPGEDSGEDLENEHAWARAVVVRRVGDRHAPPAYDRAGEPRKR